MKRLPTTNISVFNNGHDEYSLTSPMAMRQKSTVFLRKNDPKYQLCGRWHYADGYDTDHLAQTEDQDQ